MTEPTRDEVDAAIRDVALRELRSKPVGSVVMVSECIGYKKMPFWWNARVHGFWSALRFKIMDWRNSERSSDAS